MKHLKIITVVLTAALAVFLLTACDHENEKIDEIQESVQEQVAATDPSAAETAPSEPQASQETQATQETQPPTAAPTEPVQTAGDIGIEKVQAIVLAKVPGATVSNIYELERDYDDGRLEYEGSIYYNGYEYEFEVDGATGNILAWEIDD